MSLERSGSWRPSFLHSSCVAWTPPVSTMSRNMIRSLCLQRKCVTPPPRFSGIVLILLVTRQNQVDCQSEVRAFVGDTVTLPCFYNEVDVIKEKASVMWMDKDGNTLLVIVGTKTTKFNDRVESFPHLYNEGNFSLVIKEVQQSDGGPYTCQIFKMFFTKRVSLTVSGRRVPPETPAPGLPDGAASSPKSLPAIVLSLSALFLFV